MGRRLTRRDRVFPLRGRKRRRRVDKCRNAFLVGGRGRVVDDQAEIRPASTAKAKYSSAIGPSWGWRGEREVVRHSWCTLVASIRG